MAAIDDTAGEQAHGAPTNPLGRRFWLLDDTDHNDAIAELAGMLMGIHTLARVLANSEAFRVQHGANQQYPIEQAPLDALVTEGLFAALYFLSEQAQCIAEEGLDRNAADSD